MHSTWQAPSFDSSLGDASAFDSLPYPFPSGSLSSNSLRDSQQPQPGDIRRVRSSGAIQPAGSRAPSIQASWPANSQFTPTGPSSNDAAASSLSLDYFRRPSSTINLPASTAEYPATWNCQIPNQENPRPFHRRTSSAQPAFFLSASTNSWPEWYDSSTHAFAPGIAPATDRRSSVNYSFSAPSLQETHGDIFVRRGDELYNDDVRSLQTNSSILRQDTSTDSPKASSGITLTGTSSPPSNTASLVDGTPRQTYNVSGVLLNEEEYRQYTLSERNDQLARPRQYSPTTSRNQYVPQHSPSYDLQRPRSAPPSPLVDSTGTFAPFDPPPSPTAHLQQTFHQNALSPASHHGPYRPFHRRGSSVDATVPRTFMTTPTIPVPYGFASYPTLSTLTTSTPTRSNLPVGYPPPFVPTPPSGHHSQYGTPPPYSTPISRMFSSSSSSTATTFNDEAPVSPISPTRTKGFGNLVSTSPSNGVGKKGGTEGKYRYTAHSSEELASPSKTRGGKSAVKGPISFINFSASDSKALLSGVAPSGSSKKRAREESSKTEGNVSGQGAGAKKSKVPK